MRAAGLQLAAAAALTGGIVWFVGTYLEDVMAASVVVLTLLLPILSLGAPRSR